MLLIIIFANFYHIEIIVKSNGFVYLLKDIILYYDLNPNLHNMN